MRVFDGLRRVLRGLLFAFAGLVVFIAEFGWRPLSAWLALLARWALLRWLESRVRLLPARLAMGLFLIPALLLFALKRVAQA